MDLFKKGQKNHNMLCYNGPTINIFMQHWQPYVRASWELVMEAQGRSQTYLEPDIESFLVHTMARSFDKPNIWDQPVAIKMLTAQQLPKRQQQPLLKEVGEECLFIDAWEIKQPRWPNPAYFQHLGSVAFGMASLASIPADALLDLASEQFTTMSRVLRQVRDLYLGN